MKTYENMKSSSVRWLGEIPAHWIKLKGNRLFYSQKVKNKGNKEKNILSLTLKGVIRNNAEKPIGLSPLDYSTYQIFEKNDLVFKLIDLGNISTSRVGLVLERGIMSSAYIRLTARQNCNIRYFFLQYYDLWLRNVYNGLGAGVRQTLSAEDLLELEIVVPPEEEQNQIVNFVDWKVSQINRLINIKQKEIEKFEELKKFVISSKISGKKIFLKRLLLTPLQYGAESSGTAFNPELPRYVRITDIDSEGQLKNENVKSIDKTEAKPYILENDDILLARSGATVGKSFMYKSEYGICAFAGYLIRAKLDTNIILPEYFIYFTKSCDYSDWKDSIFIQSTIPNISAERYNKLPVPVPNIEEQQQIVNYLDEKTKKINNTIENKQHQIQILHELKNKIISDVVTGKIDVRNIEIPDYEPTTEQEYET